MQCYESLALRLQLLSECRLFQPDAVLDAFVLEDVLDEYGIHDFSTYNSLEPSRRLDLARRASQLSSGVGRTTHSRVA